MSMSEFFVPKQRSERDHVRFPTVRDFNKRIDHLKQMAYIEKPPVPEIPTASDVARYSKVDINTMEHRIRGYSNDFPTYLHTLAQFMLTKEAYLGVNDAGEKTQGQSLWVTKDGSPAHIQLCRDWSIGYDGSHRSLVLKILGPDFIEKSGMNKWVKVEKI